MQARNSAQQILQCIGACSRQLDFEDPECALAHADQSSVIRKSNHRRKVLKSYSTFVSCLFWTINASTSCQPGSSLPGSDWLLHCSGNHLSPHALHCEAHGGRDHDCGYNYTAKSYRRRPLLSAGSISAAEFVSNTALNLTEPDRFNTTGCELQGNSPTQSSCKDGVLLPHILRS